LADLFIDSFQALKVPFRHFARRSCQKDRLKDKG